jgi:hypothetical protein
MKTAALAVAAVLASSCAAIAGTVTLVPNYGAVAGDGGDCNSSLATSCNGTSGWIVYDDFTLAKAATMTGFTYESHFIDSSYGSTNWSLYASNASGAALISELGNAESPLGTLVASGASVVGSISKDATTGYTITTVSTTKSGAPLSIALNANTTYWLGIQNNLSCAPSSCPADASSNDVSTYGPDPDVYGVLQFDGLFELTNIGAASAAFSVVGTWATTGPGGGGGPPAAPEPSTWAMMIVGLLALGAAGYRSRVRATQSWL